MKYPQGYILLNKQTKLPPMDVLEKRFPAGADIYVRGVSKASKVLDDRIVLLEELHRYRRYFSHHHPTMNCRVKRHWIPTSTHEHGRPAEAEPAPAFYTHRPNTR